MDEKTRALEDKLEPGEGEALVLGHFVAKPNGTVVGVSLETPQIVKNNYEVESSTGEYDINGRREDHPYC